MNNKYKDILESLLYTIFIISSVEYQHRIWIKQEGPEYYSYDEAWCTLGDFEMILEEEKYKNFGFSEKQERMLQDFFSNFSRFSYDNKLFP